VASNAVQIVIARFVIFGEAARLIAPVFLVMGLVTGAILGLFTERFASTSKWYRIAKGDSSGSATGGTADCAIAADGAGDGTAHEGDSRACGAGSKGGSHV
jgi:hypothetical protein